MPSHSDVERLKSLSLEMDDPDEALARVEAEFQVTIPEPLRSEWLAVLRGGPNPLRFLTAEKLRRHIFDIAEEVHLGAVRVGMLESDAARSLVPFAHGYGEHDYVALDLTRVVDDDFGVQVCVREANVPGPAYPTSADWLAFEHAVRGTQELLDDLWTDPDRRRMLREIVRVADFDSFEEIARKTVAAAGHAPEPEVLEEAIERAWEHADPVELKPSLPPL